MDYAPNINNSVQIAQLEKLKGGITTIDFSDFDEVDQWSDRFFGQLKRFRSISWVNDELSRMWILERGEIESRSIEDATKTEYRMKAATRLIDRVIKSLDKSSGPVVSVSHSGIHKKGNARRNARRSALHNARKSCRC